MGTIAPQPFEMGLLVTPNTKDTKWVYNTINGKVFLLCRMGHSNHEGKEHIECGEISIVCNSMGVHSCAGFTGRTTGKVLAKPVAVLATYNDDTARPE